MLTILIASEHAGHLAELTRLAGQSGPYQTMALAEPPARIATQSGHLALADVLVIELAPAGPAQLQGIEAIQHARPELPCILVTPAPDAETLIHALRTGIRDVLAWPPDASRLGEALRRIEGTAATHRRKAARMVSMVSCRGGAGTSFIAANLGHALASRHDARVLLVDLSRQFGDLSYLVSDKAPPATLADACTQIERMDTAFLEACLTRVDERLDVLAGAMDPVKAAALRKDKIEWILSLALPRYDVVLVDVGQTLDPLSIAVLDRSDRIGVVLQPTIAFARTGGRLLDILRELHYADAKLRLLLNRHDRRAELDVHTVERVCGANVVHLLPDDPWHVDTAIAQGEPVLRLHPRSPIARGMAALGEAFASTAGAGPQRCHGADSPLRRLLQRARIGSGTGSTKVV